MIYPKLVAKKQKLQICLHFGCMSEYNLDKKDIGENDDKILNES